MANKYYVDVYTTETEKCKRYYKVVCGVATRISKAEYSRLEDNAEGANCFRTLDDGKVLKQHKTLIFYIDPNA